MRDMSHKFDSILDAVLKCDAGFVPSRSGEKWGYVQEYEHEFGSSKCIFETDEDGSFFELTIINDDAREDNIPELLEVINIMNGIQSQMRLFHNPKTGRIQAKQEFIVLGLKTKAVEELIAERYERMRDIFDDLLWAFDWKVKVGGDVEDLFKGLGKRSEQRSQNKKRGRGWDDFDPAYA